MRRFAFIFVFSFLLNLLWEFAHAPLYAHYMGGPITEFILVRASFWDAVILALVAIPFLVIPFLKRHAGIIFLIGIAISIYIEWFALATGRWAYGEAMPLIPFLNMGITPVIQLGILGYIAFEVAHFEIKTR